MGRWLLVIVILFHGSLPAWAGDAPSRSPSGGTLILDAHARLQAVERTEGLAGRERIQQLEAGYFELLHPRLNGGLGMLDTGDLAKALDAAGMVAFYTASDVVLDDMRALLGELERREAADNGQREQMFRMLVQAREFDEARALAARHPALEVEVLPDVVGGPPGPVDGVLVYRVDPDHSRLQAERIDVHSGSRIVMVTHPLCAFSRAAMKAIAEDARFSAALADGVTWLAPANSRLQLEVLQRWNRENPGMEIVLAHAREDWPMLEHGWATPEFYLLRDGLVVDRFAGWPKDGNHERLVELLVRAGRLKE